MEFKEKFIAFIDILGFKQLVGAAERGEGMPLSEILELAQKLGRAGKRQFFEQYGPEICPCAPCVQRDLDFRATQISDCVVLSTEISPAGGMNLISQSWSAVTALLAQGLLCRGYVTRGMIYHTDAQFIGTGYAPDPKSAVYAVAGAVATHLWTSIGKRRIIAPWTATFAKVGPNFEKTDLLISIRGIPCANLQLCTVVVSNESSRDIEDMNLLFTFNEGFVVAEANGSIGYSNKNLLLSTEFWTAVEAVKKMPEKERLQNPSYAYFLRNREYKLPSLNRGERASFQFWINSTDAAAVPIIQLSTEKSGVKLLSRPVVYRPVDVITIKRAVIPGLVMAAVALFFIVKSQTSPLLTCLLSFAVGAASTVAGMIFNDLMKFAKRMV